ncbi:MAG TPA: hypothetical protein VN327_05090 [Pseudonocardiaceae bacterium]|nr:hypothetical protein [Pseudonocardiaceae bacterium]
MSPIPGQLHGVQIRGQLITQPRHGGQWQERGHVAAELQVLNEQLQIRVGLVQRPHQLRLDAAHAVLVAAAGALMDPHPVVGHVAVLRRTPRRMPAHRAPPLRNPLGPW